MVHVAEYIFVYDVQNGPSLGLPNGNVGVMVDEVQRKIQKCIQSALPRLGARSPRLREKEASIMTEETLVLESA